MTRMKLLFAALALAAIVAVVPAANAQVVHFVGAGSSAEFQGFGVAAVNDLATTIPCVVSGSCHIHHWTVKTSHSGGCGSACSGLVDSRTPVGGSPPPEEFGNLWIVWVDDSAGTATDVWAFVSVDSIVGVRNFLATPRAKMLLASSASITGGATTPDNVMSPGLLVQGAPGNGAVAKCPSGFSANCDDNSLPLSVWNLLGGATGITITAGMTDIRPEDAKYGTVRALASTCDTAASPTCTNSLASPTPRSFALGYGPGPVGHPIKSGTGTSTAVATPVDFSLPGFLDPITNQPVPTDITTFEVGEAPLVFLVNRSNASGLGQTITSDGGPFVRNIWDQFPNPPGSVPPPASSCPAGAAGGFQYSATSAGARRPVGNMFGGALCEGNNQSFAWPNDTGCRATPTVGMSNGIGGFTFPIHLIMREPLSGTMNATEFTEFRIYGSTLGNADNGQNAVTSQERSVIIAGGVGDNPLKAKQCATGQSPDSTSFEGDRTRAIGTGELVNGSGSCSGCVNGVLNTADSIGYTFFSFNNVSKLAGAATPTNYGYTMIRQTDGLFNNYTGGDYGQPAKSGTPASWGQLPLCTPGGITTAKPDCRALAIWKGSKQETITAVSQSGSVGTYSYTDTLGVLATGDQIYITGFVNSVTSITAATETGTTDTYTYTLTSGDDIVVGDTVKITGFTDAGNNGTFIVTANPGLGGAGTFDVTNAAGVTDSGQSATGTDMDSANNGFFTVAAVPGSGGAGTFDVTNPNGETATGATATGNSGVANTYPHLRDGSYPAWSILRIMCETSSAHCLFADDNFGAEALLRNMQDDIHFNHIGGVPDLLPFSDDNSFGPGNNLGDVSFVREHFGYGKALSVSSYPTPTSTHLSVPQVDFHSEPCSGGSAPGTPNQAAPGGPGECGGDAGGFIVAPSSAATTVLQ